MYSELAHAMAHIIPPRKKTWIDLRPPTNSCIFCGESPTTREHIWPHWSHKYLPTDQNFHWAVLAIELLDQSYVRVMKRNGDQHHRQIKAVCKGCNGGWMREVIEDTATPVLTRLFTGSENPTRITEREQGLIARWIALRAIVSEYDDGAPRITHHKQRKMLYRRHAISDTTWRIWIANHENRQSAMQWQEHPFLVLPTHVADRKKSRVATYVNSQVLTYVIGKLLIHVMHCPNPVTLRLWQFPPQVSGKMRRIWPPTSLSIVWPPPALTDEEAGILGVAFKRFMSNISRARAGLETF